MSKKRKVFSEVEGLQEQIRDLPNEVQMLHNEEAALKIEKDTDTAAFYSKLAQKNDAYHELLNNKDHATELRSNKKYTHTHIKEQRRDPEKN
jgi:hypothetical protein